MRLHNCNGMGNIKEVAAASATAISITWVVVRMVIVVSPLYWLELLFSLKGLKCCAREAATSPGAEQLVLLSAGPSLSQGCPPDHRFCAVKSGGQDGTHPSKTLSITLSDRAPWPPPTLKKPHIPIFTGNWGARAKACLASICRNSF